MARKSPAPPTASFDDELEVPAGSPGSLTPYAPTDGPNDKHWAGGTLHQGLGAFSPTLTRPSKLTETQAVAIREQANAVSVAQDALQREREAFKAEVAAYEAAKAERERTA
jgi:hypothetical protein